CLLCMETRIPECLDCLTKIRTSHQLAGVVLLTADQMDEAARCEELGFPNLLKPPKPSELRSMLAANLHPAVPAATTAAPQDRGPTDALQERGRILLAEDGLVNQRLA